MTNNAMISVIIPSYNYGHYIGDALKGIIAQTYTNWEVIVVDDDSTDNTKEVVSAFAQQDSRIKYIHQPNSGPSAARNNGIKHCTGEYIQFLDPDDFFERKKFEIQAALFGKMPEVDVVYGNLRYFTKSPFDPNDRQFTFWGGDHEWIPKLAGNGLSFLAEALNGNFTHLSSTLFRKRIVDLVGGFDVANSAPSDYTFILYCVINNAAFFYHDDVETYSLVRWHSGNLSKNLTRMMEEEVKMRQELIPFIKNDDEALKKNEYIIKSLELKLNNSWKKHFLSGGKFDFLKNIIRSAGLERLVQKLFYK